ncbi:MAG: transposase [Chloroflexota bacterium]|nr:transposase [Chloroflexota bacterium]
MRTANQLTFTTYEASLKIKPDDPIKVIFENIDWSFVHLMAKDKYSSVPQGADGYDPISLFKAQLLIYTGEVESDRKLAKALRYNARLCYLCGFNFLKTPSHATFTYFRDRLGANTFYEILHQLISQAWVLKVIHGGDTAIDSTHLWAYSNKDGKKSCSCKGKCEHEVVHSDPDARWGKKRKDYSFFGYKAHLIVDTKSQLPLEVTITGGNEEDTCQVKALLEGAKAKHSGTVISSVAMDAAYDAYENYRFVIDDMKASPIIALNPRSEYTSKLGKISLAEDGSYRCEAGLELIHSGTDKKRKRMKFRCPAVLGKCHCDLQAACSPSKYGRTFYVSLYQDYRLRGPIPRGSEMWQEKYNGRTSVERAYSEEKGSHRLDDLRFRQMVKVRTHVYMALCAQVVKKIGVAITQKLSPAPTIACPVRA